MKVEEAAEKCQQVVGQVKKVIVGKEPVLEKVTVRGGWPARGVAEARAVGARLPPV